MEITLIYPHQLFATHPAVAEGRRIHLVEDPLLFGNDAEWPAAMHRQKLVLYRAAMRAYAGELEDQGHAVTCIECPDGSDVDSRGLLEQALPETVTQLHLADPADDVLMRRIERFARERGAELEVHASPNFLTPADFLAKYTGGMRKASMARFYSAQRKRMKILLDGEGGPVGGKWSYDEDNRKKLPKDHLPPAEPVQAPNGHVREAIDWVARRFPDSPGSTGAFRWPVTRADAEVWLERFFDERFHDFGHYEDAISTEHATLHHSAITPMLNIGLLDPQDVVDRALAVAKKHGVPLNSLEGFIRQIIGWREFMCGIYRHRGGYIRTSNFWGFTRRMPAAFYDGTTGIPPVDRVIRQVLRDGYCHHIERLMVLGNFMLLCRLHPDDVYRWFLEMFVDSTDWVMVANVYGMSQFADGGTFTTKPYLSGSNYILKMSDETRGPWCDIWNGLFWSFIGDYEDFFLGNPRLSMMARSWQRLGTTKQADHRRMAKTFLESL